tara:strand:- start:9680 stop:10468 length:789 start_codon:yes stop_codon:yes gene_type:complete
MRYLSLVLLFCISCSQVQKNTPSFIHFKFKNDSTIVFAENKLACPTHLIITDLKSNRKQIIDFAPFDKKQLFKTKDDTLRVLKNNTFSLLYGPSIPLKEYDTLYNYNLPFLKGKRYKILQGQSTNFTHKGAKSRYAIDFKMNIGQTICAMRDGVVVSIKEDSNKGGRSKKYLNDGNYVMLYHTIGLYTQYVHLKKEGVFVEIGETIRKGQPIAYSGNTGMSTEPHLHFGVFKATPKGFVSIPYILDSIPTNKYVKGKFAIND